MTSLMNGVLERFGPAVKIESDCCCRDKRIFSTGCSGTSMTNAVAL